MKTFRFISDVLGIMIIIVFAVFLICVWGSIPEVVPTHFNAAGIADDYGNKSSLFIEIGIMIVSFVFITVMEYFPRLWNYPVEVTAENRDRLYCIVLYMVCTVKILVLGLCISVALASIYRGFPGWVTMILAGMVLVVVIAGIAACFINR